MHTEWRNRLPLINIRHPSSQIKFFINWLLLKSVFRDNFYERWSSVQRRESGRKGTGIQWISQLYSISVSNLSSLQPRQLQSFSCHWQIKFLLLSSSSVVKSVSAQSPVIHIRSLSNVDLFATPPVHSAVFEYMATINYADSCGNMWVNTLHAAIPGWLNTLQRSRVGVGMNRSARGRIVKRQTHVVIINNGEMGQRIRKTVNSSGIILFNS